MTARSPSRVVHLIPALFGRDGVFGGAERYALELARAMAERVPTTLVAFGRRASVERLGALDVRVLRNWVPVRRFHFDPVTPWLWPILRRADVIHTHQPSTAMAHAARLYARWTGRAVVASHLGGGGAWGLSRILDDFRGCRGILHISEFSRRVFGHATEPRASVVWGGVDTDRFRPDPTTGPDRPVLFVGRLLPHKGVDYLIDGVEPNWPLEIVGRPQGFAQPYWHLLERKAAGKAVRFVTDSDDDALVRHYQRALCVVLPSVHDTVYGDHATIPELLGQTLIEGMACGRPAVATAVASLPEVVEDGVTGFVVPPNDPGALRAKIGWLRDHPEETDRMGRAARARVLERFTWPAVVERCLDCYRQAGANV